MNGIGRLLAKFGCCAEIVAICCAVCLSAAAEDRPGPAAGSAGDKQAASSIAASRGSTGVESMVSEGGVAVVISKSGNSLYGYSAKTGNWDRVRVQEPDGRPILPVLGGGVACAIVGKHAYGFSETKGRWETVEVAPGATQMVSQHLCWIVAGSKIFMFSDTTGRWSIADMSQDAK
jgi:hypothetical protein